MVFACFNFKCRHKVLILFVFDADNTVDVTLDAICVRVKLLLRGDEVVVLDTKLIFVALKNHVKPFSDVLYSSLSVLNHLFLLFTETVQQKQFCFDCFLNKFVDCLLTKVHFLKYILKDLVNYVTKY